MNSSRLCLKPVQIILPVVERSVTIAGISTRELVTKDFATEPNEETLRQAAHRMAQNLAGSLALVTCKEPLRSNLSSHMRQFLNEQGFTEVCPRSPLSLPHINGFHSKWHRTKLCSYLFKITSSSLAVSSKKQRWIVLLPTWMRTLRLLTNTVDDIVRYLSFSALCSAVSTYGPPRQIEDNLSGMYLL
jgi:Domain of unknown function (DUF3819)